MKRVTQHGNTVFISEAVCPVCGCRFEYEEEDIEHLMTNNDEVVRCPECDCLIELENNE